LSKRLFILVAFAAAVWWTLSASFVLSDIKVEAPAGRSVLGSADSQRVESELRELVGGQWQQQSLLTLNSDELKSELLAKDPRVSTVDIIRTWPHGIRADVEMKIPVLVWFTGGQRYEVDAAGKVMGQITAASSLPAVNDGSNLPVKAGEQIVTDRFSTFVGDLASGLAGVSGLKVISYDVKETTNDLYVKVSGGYTITFDSERSAAEQLGDLKTLLAYLQKHRQKPTEYIDLRIAQRAYYK
jgi:cell division septal protein FtsQ